MRLTIFLFLVSSLALAACSAAAPPQPALPTPASPSSTASPAMPTASRGQPADLPDLGPAPELTNTTWLNTPEPLRLEDLRGKVVLLDMWTFG